MTRIISSIALLSVLLSCGTGEAKRPGMCAKEPMAPDGIVRLSKIEVYPQYLDEYVKHAAKVGEVSLRTGEVVGKTGGTNAEKQKNRDPILLLLGQ